MFAALRNRGKNVDVTIGQRFRKADAPLIVWEVASMFDGTDGVPYAGIICIADPSQRKTVAQEALVRGLQYQRLR